jgi:predicted DCC family thiol-disulfide oxidoreductase YuxK
MKKLYVLYDHGCGLCCSAARWLREEPQHIELEVMPAMSMRARDLFPTLCSDAPGEVLAISDAGEVYRGPTAWIMCLYALKRRRGLAFQLAQPRWRPLVSTAIKMLSENRAGLSRLMALTPESAQAQAPIASEQQGCDGECGVAAAEGSVSPSTASLRRWR